VLFLVVCRSMAEASTATPGEDTPTRLLVAVVESPPFAIKEADGTWSGLSIDLWQEVARDLGRRWDLREVALNEVDALLHDHQVDAALGAIAITHAGEEEHDYSQAFLSTGLGFAEAVRSGPSWRAALGAMANSELVRVVLLMILATVVVGVLIALIERRGNPREFGGPLPRSVGTGVWWAAVTMTTVGYGDATPKSASGRTLALIWMFVGVVAVAIFTATVTSMLTVDSLRGAVQRPADLFRRRLGAVEGGTGAEFIRDHHAQFHPYLNYEDALAGLAAGEVDAVVANIPALEFMTRARWQGVLRVAPFVLEPHSFAIGLPEGSPLREPINRAVLRVVEGDRWRDVERQYLGGD
jgi:polar amino acid transport system substrate-binding protein